MSTQPGPHAIVEQLFKSHYSWLRARVWARMGDSFIADDVASETFVQLASLPDPSAIREPRALLTTISRRIGYEIWRRRDLERACVQAMAVQGDADLAPSPEEQALLQEALFAIDTALQGLSLGERQAFLLYRFEDLTHAQIGEQIGCAPSVARRYIAKALKHCYLAIQ